MISSIVSKLSSSSSSSFSSSTSSSNSTSKPTSKFLKFNNSSKKQTKQIKINTNTKKKFCSKIKISNSNIENVENLNSIQQSEKTEDKESKMNYPNLNSYFTERLLSNPFENLNLNENKASYETENAVAESLFNNNQTKKLMQNIDHDINFSKLSLEPTTSSHIKELGRFIDEPEYRMNHAKRGYAVIINNKRFDSRLDMPVRDGTDLDAACLESTFKKLGFDTKLFHNCSASLIRDLVSRYARADHSDSDCFLCVLMSHGENGIIYGTDKEIEIEQIIQPFKFNRTLAGKPKLFFIQACRGTQLMEGIDSNPYEVRYVNKIPMEADFLIAYSTIAGYYSWRNSLNGSWFIQSLCKIFNEYGKKMEIMQLMTHVNREVAYHFRSNTSDPEMSDKRQVPCIVSMLTKELYFKPKLNHGSTISISYN